MRDTSGVRLADGDPEVKDAIMEELKNLRAQVSFLYALWNAWDELKVEKLQYDPYEEPTMEEVHLRAQEWWERGKVENKSKWSIGYYEGLTYLP